MIDKAADQVGDINWNCCVTKTTMLLSSVPLKIWIQIHTGDSITVAPAMTLSDRTLTNANYAKNDATYR